MRQLTPIALSLLVCLPLCAQSPVIQAKYDARGLTLLSYGYTTLIDLANQRGDGFLVGTYKLASRSAWGAVGNKVSWDASASRLTWSWDWGRVECVYKIDAPHSALQVKLTVTNSGKDELQAINIYPLGLQFPKLPATFGAPNYPQFRNGLDGPPVLIADYADGEVTILHREPTPLFIGLSPSGPPNHYLLQAGTLTDDSTGFLGKALPVHRPVAPGQSDTYNIELRFSRSGLNLVRTAPDVLHAYGAAYPSNLHWPDRRPIGELFLTEPATKARAEQEPNPRGYNFASKVNVNTPDGQAQFRELLLSYADRAIATLKKAGAQGALIWDLEGQQYPQPNTSYIGDPSLLGRLSPEMDRVADEFFTKFKQAGLRCGLTLRPQHLDLQSRPPHQMNVDRGREADALIAKISYARHRWGCTLFYVDSDGGPFDASSPSTFETITRRFPDILLIPENIWPRDYAYTAPLASFTAPYKALHTPDWVQAIWPKAFSVTYIGDAPNHSLKSSPALWADFQNAHARGDVFAFRGWFDDQPLNSQLPR